MLTNEVVRVDFDPSHLPVKRHFSATRQSDATMNVQQAIEAPRVKLVAGYHALAEGRIPTSVTDELNARGHAIERAADLTWLVGGMHGVYRDPETSVLMGGADPRRDGYAVGW